MPFPNPVTRLHIVIRHHLSGVIIAWLRRVVLTVLVTNRQIVMRHKPFLGKILPMLTIPSEGAIALRSDSGFPWRGQPLGDK